MDIGQQSMHVDVHMPLLISGKIYDIDADAVTVTSSPHRNAYRSSLPGSANTCWTFLAPTN
jgi:hypothetical protein